jgi:hypothetical protein
VKKILIISDFILGKELSQNGILSYLCIKSRTLIQQTCSFEKIDPDEYEMIILWTHTLDSRDYSVLMEKDDGKVRRIHFEKSLQYLTSHSNHSILNIQYEIKENPDYYKPSKFKKNLFHNLKATLKL